MYTEANSEGLGSGSAPNRSPQPLHPLVRHPLQPTCLQPKPQKRVTLREVQYAGKIKGSRNDQICPEDEFRNSLIFAIAI